MKKLLIIGAAVVAIATQTANAADPYIESTLQSNTSGISTGYRMNGDSRGGTRTGDGYIHTYQAIAVFNDFYGVNRESEPSAIATVTSVPFGMAISFK